MTDNEWICAPATLGDIVAVLIFGGLGWTYGVYGVLLEERVRKHMPTRLVRWTIVAWVALAVVFAATGLILLWVNHAATTWRLLLIAGGTYALMAALLICCLPLFGWLVWQTMLDPQRGTACTMGFGILLNFPFILALHVVMSQDPHMFPEQGRLGVPWLVGVIAGMPLFVYVLYRRWRDSAGRKH